MNDDYKADKSPDEQLRNGEASQDLPQEDAQGNPRREYPIADNTEQHYEKIVKGLWNYAENKKSSNAMNSNGESTNPMDLVRDLSERVDLNQNTVMTYAYALRWHFKKNGHIQDFADAMLALDQFIDQIKSTFPVQGVREGKRPKAGNSIPKDDLDELITELTERSAGGASIWAGPAQRWLLAGLATGLRPGEWLTAEWVDEKKSAIRLTTSKVKVATAGFMRESRADENYVPDLKTREIPVTFASDRMVIDVHLETSKAHVLSGNMSFHQFHNDCGRQIALSCKAIWGNKKTYTLNSGRKQFSANMRAEVGKAKTAILMGHTQPNTPAASAYGKASQAYSRTGKNYRKNTQKENKAEGWVDFKTEVGPTAPADDERGG